MDFSIDTLLLILCKITIIKSVSVPLTYWKSNSPSNTESVLIELLLKNDKPESISFTKFKEDPNSDIHNTRNPLPESSIFQEPESHENLEVISINEGNLDFSAITYPFPIKSIQESDNTLDPIKFIDFDSSIKNYDIRSIELGNVHQSFAEKHNVAEHNLEIKDCDELAPLKTKNDMRTIEFASTLTNCAQNNHMIQELLDQSENDIKTDSILHCTKNLDPLQQITTESPLPESNKYARQIESDITRSPIDGLLSLSAELDRSNLLFHNSYSYYETPDLVQDLLNQVTRKETSLPLNIMPATTSTVGLTKQPNLPDLDFSSTTKDFVSPQYYQSISNNLHNENNNLLDNEGLNKAPDKPMKSLPNWENTLKFVNDAYRANMAVISSTNNKKDAKLLNKQVNLAKDISENSPSSIPFINKSNTREIDSPILNQGCLNNFGYYCMPNIDNDFTSNTYEITATRFDHNRITNNMDPRLNKTFQKTAYDNTMNLHPLSTSNSLNSIHSLHSLDYHVQQNSEQPLVKKSCIVTDACYKPSYNVPFLKNEIPYFSEAHVVTSERSQNFPVDYNNIMDLSPQSSNCNNFKGFVDIIEPLTIAYLSSDQYPLVIPPKTAQLRGGNYALPLTSNAPLSVNHLNGPLVFNTPTTIPNYVQKPTNDYLSSSLNKLVPALTSNIISALLSNSLNKQTNYVSYPLKVSENPSSLKYPASQKPVDVFTPPIIPPVILPSTTYVSGPKNVISKKSGDLINIPSITPCEPFYPETLTSYLSSQLLGYTTLSNPDTEIIGLINPPKCENSVLSPFTRIIVPDDYHESPNSSSVLSNSCDFVTPLSIDSCLSAHFNSPFLTNIPVLNFPVPTVEHITDLHDSSVPRTDTLLSIIDFDAKERTNNADLLVPYIASININVMPPKDSQKIVLL